MTYKLYYDNDKLSKFKANIITSKPFDNGYAVQLNQTAFYPTSGGQPFDTGHLDDIPVLNVWEDEGHIWHLLDSLPDNQTVKGQIDWPRRFDHMQQHTGQHILSAYFLDTLRANTIGFHIGEKFSTIDLDINGIGKEGFQTVEEKANVFLYENHPVKIECITEKEIKDLPFRKPPQVSGKIRVVLIGNLDVSACGGTHVGNTGEIGIIKIIGSERYKGGTRIKFLCGKRALQDYRKIQENVQKISRELSINPEDLTDKITQIQEEAAKHLKYYKNTRKELMSLYASRLWIDTQLVKGIKPVTSHWNDLSFDDLREITNTLRENPKTAILLACTQNNSIRLICSKSSDLDSINADSIIKETTNKLGGKGGGTPEMAQGGAPISDHETIIVTLQSTLINSI